VTKSNEVLIDRGAADRGFAAAPGPSCQDALECDPACTTVPWHCCHVRERLQVRAPVANRGSALKSCCQCGVGERLAGVVVSVVEVVGVGSCSGKATRDEV
jgi:hypothetical protein